MEKVTFETNVPQRLALKYPAGRQVESRFGGDQVMFTLADGRVMYQPPFVAEKVHALQLASGEEFVMVRKATKDGLRKGIEWQVYRDSAPPTRVEMAKRTDSVATEPPAAPMNGNGQTSADILARCYEDAIAIALGAVLSAKAKGLLLSPTFEDVRTMAATIYINENGGRK